MSDSDHAGGATDAQAQLSHLETQAALHAASEHVSAPPSGRSVAAVPRRTSSSASLATTSAASDDLRAAKSQIQALQRGVFGRTVAAAREPTTPASMLVAQQQKGRYATATATKTLTTRLVL